MPNNWKFFFINEARPMIHNNRQPQDIYNHFHRKIAKRQEAHLKILNPVFTLIDTEIRNSNIIASDETEKLVNIEKVKMLSKLSTDIRNLINKDDSVFLTSLENVLKYKFE